MAVRNTCPWLPADGQSVPNSARQRSASKPADKDTCPWGRVANDADSVRLAAAERRRQRPSPSFSGAAGSGAPKMTEALKQAALAAPSVADGGLEAPPVASDDKDEGYDTEADDESEQQRLIDQCLAEGLEKEQILEILEEWHCAKMVERTRLQQKRQQANAPETVQSSTMKPVDAEASYLSQSPAKENITPFDAIPNSNEALVSLAAKRSKARQTSNASVGAFDSNNSREAYFQSKNQAQAARSKNHAGAGIF